MEDVHSSPVTSEYTDDFLSKLAVETPVIKRRGSAGMKLMRTASISKIFPSRSTHDSSKHASKNLGSSWGDNSFGFVKGNDSYSIKGNESATDITLSNSMSSFEEDEFTGLNLIKDIDIAIIELNKKKTKTEKKIDNILELAKARYEGGGTLGALVSMRRVHRNRTKLAYIAATRYQLTEMRKQIESYMKQGDFDFDVPTLRNHARDIMSKMQSASDCPAPSDDELLRRLFQEMNMVEI